MIYSETIETKTGQKIPLYSNGHPAHSKYNPSNEKLNLPEGFTGCVICAGIAGSFHIAGIIDRPERESLQWKQMNKAWNLQKAWNQQKK